MKKTFFFLLMTVFLFSCSYAESVFAFELPEYEVLIGKQIKVQALPQGIEGKLIYQWSSDDESVATVKNGTVTGKNPGQAVVTCTAVTTDGVSFSDSCTVTVIKPIASIQADNRKVTLASLDLFADVQPEYGEAPFYYQAEVIIRPEDASNKTLNWSTSSPLVANVDQNGMISGGYQAGTATIKAEATDGSGRYVTFTVTVPEIYTTSDKIVIDSEEGLVWGYQMNGGGLSTMGANDSGVFSWEREEDIGGISKVRIIPIKEGSGSISIRSGKTKKTIPVTVKSSAVRSDKTYPPCRISDILNNPEKYSEAKVGIKNAEGVEFKIASRLELLSYKDSKDWDNRYTSSCGYAIMRVQEDTMQYFAVEYRNAKALAGKKGVKVYGKVVGFISYVSPTGLSYECPVIAFATAE